MTARVDPKRLLAAYDTVRAALLRERCADGYWVGELSTSALSTATAVVALEMVRRQLTGDTLPSLTPSPSMPSPSMPSPTPPSTMRPTNDSPRVAAMSDANPQQLRELIDGGLTWLAAHQNEDGGWGDTVLSFSNVSTTMLCNAAFHAVRTTSASPDTTGDVPDGHVDRFERTVRRSEQWVDAAGGVGAVLRRYGRDRTFSVPILTHCALAGRADWRSVIPLPFELACIPHQFYKTVRLPVVSYALPALIAIGQVRFHYRKPWNPLTRFIRSLARKRSLRVLERIQPPNGGFLEAAPLTSFVTMSLAAMGLHQHPVVRKGVRFLIDSVRSDGSWPIDTNLATWVTTLSINALRDELPYASHPVLLRFLLDQQYRTVHPYTNAEPGGWAWTNLPGGVPDADDTPGAMLALMQLSAAAASTDRAVAVAAPSADAGDLLGVGDSSSSAGPIDDEVDAALRAGVHWLLNLQNRDGGWPTFCRGWGALPFDRSAADISAHVLRAFHAWRDWNRKRNGNVETRLRSQVESAMSRGFRYLERCQRADGSWLPLWFGNQFNTASHFAGSHHASASAPSIDPPAGDPVGNDDENPTYGTARVLLAWRDCGQFNNPAARRAVAWLRWNQNSDGGWGGVRGTPSSIEETSLAVEALIADEPQSENVIRGVNWLIEQVESGGYRDPSPIGFYFAKLWYFEALYPVTFLASALNRAGETLAVR